MTTQPAPAPPAAPALVRRDLAARLAAEEALSPAGTRSRGSRGRRRREAPDADRTPFEVDRDRVLHSKAFRRLKHKTQVFLGGAGGDDHVVTRMTHALQVTQVARALAAGLGLNEPLAEAIALAHDVGHAPFGHTGEEALAALVPGWHHAAQGVRVLEVLEDRNLTWEALDGVRAHSWRVDPPPATPEGQCVRLADRIAYLTHDALDALRAGVLSPGDFPPVVRDALGPPGGTWIGRLVDAVLSESAARGTVCMRPAEASLMDELRAFMFDRVYHAAPGPQALADRIIRELAEHHLDHPEAIPRTYRDASADPLTQTVDYVAGMTDRYALACHRALLGPALADRLLTALARA